MFDFDVYVSIDSPLAKNYLSLIYIWMVHKNRKDLDYNIFFKKKWKCMINEKVEIYEMTVIR
jgi:hypothetical protein